MRRILSLAALASLAFALLSFGFVGAAEPNAASGAPQSPMAAAVAIGQLKEQDGGIATIDLRAGNRDGRTSGNLRFYSSEVGYYNGAVRRLPVVNGAIQAAGGGGLLRPDGSRVRVRFTADLSADGQQVTITIKGANGAAYSLSGKLDPGFVKAGMPGRVQEPAQPKPQR